MLKNAATWSALKTANAAPRGGTALVVEQQDESDGTGQVQRDGGQGDAGVPLLGRADALQQVRLAVVHLCRLAVALADLLGDRGDAQPVRVHALVVRQVVQPARPQDGRLGEQLHDEEHDGQNTEKRAPRRHLNARLGQDEHGDDAARAPHCGQELRNRPRTHVGLADDAAVAVDIRVKRLTREIFGLRHPCLLVALKSASRSIIP